MSVIELVGVVQDGTAYAPGVPRDTARTIQFPRSETTNINVCVLAPSGEEIDLSGGFSAVLTVRRAQNPLDPSFDLQKTVTTLTPLSKNRFTFAIASADTRLLTPQRYWFDVWLTRGGARTQIVRAGALFLQPALAVG